MIPFSSFISFPLASGQYRLAFFRPFSSSLVIITEEAEIPGNSMVDSCLPLTDDPHILLPRKLPEPSKHGSCWSLNGNDILIQVRESDLERFSKSYYFTLKISYPRGVDVVCGRITDGRFQVNNVGVVRNNVLISVPFQVQLGFCH